MFKNFLISCCAVAILIFTNATVQAEQENEFVGIFPDTGKKCYLVIDSINHLPDKKQIGMTALFKLIDSNNNEEPVEYWFWFEEDSKDSLILHFGNSLGDSGIVPEDENVIERKMFQATAKYFAG